jgi:hypothetical protein
MKGIIMAKRKRKNALGSPPETHLKSLIQDVKTLHASAEDVAKDARRGHCIIALAGLRHSDVLLGRIEAHLTSGAGTSLGEAGMTKYSLAMARNAFSAANKDFNNSCIVISKAKKVRK